MFHYRLRAQPSGCNHLTSKGYHLAVELDQGEDGGFHQYSDR